MSSTILGAGTRIEGAVHSTDDLVIEGTVNGPVHGEAAVTLAAGACVSGEVRGREVVIGSSLQASVFATQTIRLQATAEVRGDLHAPRVGIDEGALFEGQIKMARAATAPASTVTDRRAPTSPMRAAAPESPPAGPPAPRAIPDLPLLGRRKALRRAAR